MNWRASLMKEDSAMLRFPSCSLRKDRAVSTIIGGLIMLALILSALGTMVFVSEQYDQYQQIDRRITQYQNQQLSEQLVINSPGLTVLSSAGSWGSGCVSKYNCYNITVSNFGGVGVQIVRIYINSTGPLGQGCNPELCILNPTSTIANYAFNQANQFLNPGEVNHAIVIALPGGSNGVVLPSPTPAFPQNTVMLVTARGNVFSFQWPFQTLSYGQSQSAFSSGIMKVAYQCSSTSTCSCSSTSGCDSKNEPGVTGGTAGSTYCHTEPLVAYPAPSYDAEQLSGIYLSNTAKVGDNGVLTFVNPWITNTILESAATTGFSSNPNATQMYVYVNVINTSGTSYSPVAGSIDFTWYGQNHLDGILIGVFYKGTYYLSTQAITLSIAPGANFYAIFHINIVKLGDWSPNTPNTPWTAGNWALPIMWWGSASITNDYENGQFFSGSILLSGLWIRFSC